MFIFYPGIFRVYLCLWRDISGLVVHSGRFRIYLGGYIVSTCFLLSFLDISCRLDIFVECYQQALSYYFYYIIFICPSFDGKSLDIIVEKFHHLMDVCMVLV